MLLEYEVLNVFEKNGLPRKKAEALATAMIEANRSPAYFNPGYYTFQLESAGFSQKDAKEYIGLIKDIFNSGIQVQYSGNSGCGQNIATY